MTSSPQGSEAQPVSTLEWVPRDALQSNTYNPNRVAPPELRLLRLSILEDGWTQPIVARPDGEVVDGFHRWTVSGEPDVGALTTRDGVVYVPVVRINPDPAGQRMATIRHNRARGSHHVVKMADIVAELVAMGCDEKELQVRLGMDAEEVVRLLERGKMTKRGATEEMSQAWRPAPRRQ